MPSDADSRAARSPGVARDIGAQTVLADVLPFFNDTSAVQEFVRVGITPYLDRFSEPVRYADLGGGDGFLASIVSRSLATRFSRTESIVVDDNPKALLRAQRIGMRVQPAAIEQLRASGTNLFTMRLVSHYNGLKRLRAMLGRTFENLSPGGLFVSQIETGSRALCVFRSVLARRLGRLGAGRESAKQGECCRWIASPAYERLLQQQGFDAVKVVPEFMKFDTRLDTLLELGFERYGLKGDAHRAARDSLASEAERLADRLLPKGEELYTAKDGRKYVRSSQALFVATKPLLDG